MILTRLCARRDWRLNASQTRHLEIRNSLNTNMRTEQYENPKNIAAWLSNRFDHKRSANIRLDLLSSQTTTDGFLSINDEQAEKIARRFRNDLNQFCFGNAARRGHKELIITIALQKDPHWHFHRLKFPNISLLSRSNRLSRTCLANQTVGSSKIYIVQKQNQISERNYTTRVLE